MNVKFIFLGNPPERCTDVYVYTCVGKEEDLLRGNFSEMHEAECIRFGKYRASLLAMCGLNSTYFFLAEICF